ncbi:hypothetical protein EYF80_041161 [Liparis tanakae]|uniref:Uncharacterized protein n=1 Tax=Liparis tanakae TaxID=230148 RepID=A0A4Z2G6T4_9TELE|nr:hypothetical protein EYF80_041161 [Liparis tanakae]
MVRFNGTMGPGGGVPLRVVGRSLGRRLGPQRVGEHVFGVDAPQTASLVSGPRAGLRRLRGLRGFLRWPGCYGEDGVSELGGLTDCRLRNGRRSLGVAAHDGDAPEHAAAAAAVIVAAHHAALGRRRAAVLGRSRLGARSHFLAGRVVRLSGA